MQIQQPVAILVALFSTYALSEWNLRGFTISAFHLAALMATYSTLLPKRQGNRDGIPFVDIERLAIPVSARTCVSLCIILALEITVIGSGSFDVGAMLAVASFKTVSLLFLFHTVRLLLETVTEHLLTRTGTRNIMDGFNRNLHLFTVFLEKPILATVRKRGYYQHTRFRRCPCADYMDDSQDHAVQTLALGSLSTLANSVHKQSHCHQQCTLPGSCILTYAHTSSSSLGRKRQPSL